MDIIVGHLRGIGYSNPSISLLKNDGHGNFSIYDTSLSFLGVQHDIICTQIDGDNYPEIVANYQVVDNDAVDSYVRVIYLDENGYGNIKDFSTIKENGTSNQTYGDINGDSYTYIIIASYGD